METTVELDDLMGELGLESSDSTGMLEYLSKCGGFDIIDFEGHSSVPKEQVAAAKKYAEEIKALVDPSRIMVERQVSRVWLVLHDFYYKLEGVGVTTDES